MRPRVLTALGAAVFVLARIALYLSLGSEFLPKLQRPLATVVIGGIVTSTFLTLLVLPAVYPWFARRSAQEPGDVSGI